MDGPVQGHGNRKVLMASELQRTHEKSGKRCAPVPPCEGNSSLQIESEPNRIILFQVLFNQMTSKADGGSGIYFKLGILIQLMSQANQLRMWPLFFSQ